MKRTQYILIAIISSLMFSSCEDTVDVDLEDGIEQLAVDAFLTNHKNPEVVITMTQNYFDSSESNYVSDATVSVSDGTNDYELTFSDNAYRFDSPIITAEDLDYTLTIEHDGNVYEAFGTTQPVPPIDSIIYEFEETSFGIDSGYFAEFISFDIAGRTDFYWARYFRNDSLQNDPTALILSQDAAFSGDGADGFLFIPPIRQGINDFTRRYQPGENLKVELWSIEENTWQYLSEVVEQTNVGGPLAIISPPTYNLRSNITHVSGPAEQPPLGMFSVSLVSANEVTFE